MLNFFKIFIILITLFFTNTQLASEILIYADNIDYDKNDNLVANGNVKILFGNQILASDLVIFNKKLDQYIIPKNFEFKDENDNFYSGTSGIFTKNFENAEIENVKILLNDGSRIVGTKAKRTGEIDIISKGVYTPCKSRIKIGNFICPTWQLDGEKILHDNENLFLYQKHSKMRILNSPVFYLPYLVTPSPLRKKRKSGFLTPSLNFKFLDTKVSQHTSFPYYFNLSVDKELTFTPMINYGGGVDSSQRFLFDYNQILSGGTLTAELQFDSNFEKENNDKWLKDASIITKYENKINTKYKVDIESTFQTSNNYIQTSNPNNDLSYSSSLKTSINLHGYNLNKIDDNMLLNFSTYQVNQNNEDNKNIPTVLPFANYYSGNIGNEKNKYSYSLKYYNIFRDKNTSVHAQKQQKISSVFYTEKEFVNFRSNFKFLTETHAQYFIVQNKKIDSNNVSSNYFRFFPIIGIYGETPFKLKSNIGKFIYKPNWSFILTPGQSNSNKLSNEESSNNLFSIDNNINLNRYVSDDKLDNSKRLNYGITINNEKINLDLSQYYEFTNNSNYHNELGNTDHLSDLLANLSYNTESTKADYNIRYDVDRNGINRQTISINNKNKYGEIELNYLDEKKETNDIIVSSNESFNYNYKSKKFLNYNRINFKGQYNLQEDKHNEYGALYSYFDECFGVTLSFDRKFYSDEELKPEDVLTLMFSFKNVGSYKSSNLAVSETDKQDIEWENFDIENDFFN